MTFSLDLTTQAFMVGFFGCLMSVFPVCMLALLPRDGWTRGEVLEDMRNRVIKLEIMIADRNNIIDSLLKESFERHKESSHGKKPASNKD
jgi:hypothetical protein